ncbi:MAG: hypothetical protein HZY75_08355 [Nocardioidaceae bacterium]|nr:MAG: hypothetical protein HZY75_08355 [Nocardioidaceae bacterium]
MDEPDEETDARAGGDTGPAGEGPEIGSLVEEALKLVGALQGWVTDLARSVNPEVKEHLADAASSLVSAVAAALATPVSPAGPSSGTPPGTEDPPVERIDLEGEE